MAVAHSLVNLATNLDLTVPALSSIVVELLQNGVPVPGFTITYLPGESGIKSVVAGPQPYAIGDAFDLRVTASNVTSGGPVSISATVGVE